MRVLEVLEFGTANRLLRKTNPETTPFHHHPRLIQGIHTLSATYGSVFSKLLAWEDGIPRRTCSRRPSLVTRLISYHGRSSPWSGEINFILDHRQPKTIPTRREAYLSLSRYCICSYLKGQGPTAEANGFSLAPGFTVQVQAKDRCTTSRPLFSFLSVKE